jgi:hypothetical protein
MRCIDCGNSYHIVSHVVTKEVGFVLLFSMGTRIIFLFQAVIIIITASFPADVDIGRSPVWAFLIFKDMGHPVEIKYSFYI